LDQLAVIKGWHEKSESGIYSNEVKDTRSDPFVVKAFKGGIIVEGLYGTIRDRVLVAGGHFTTNCYIAYKTDKGLALGSIQFKGATLNAWVEFCKANRADLYKKAIKIKGYDQGKKGKIEFRTPKFFLADVTADTDKAALTIDKSLQEYLKGYFGRTKVEQVARPAAPEEAQEPAGCDVQEPASEEPPTEPEDSGQIPF